MLSRHMSRQRKESMLQFEWDEKKHFANKNERAAYRALQERYERSY
jgi:hypothetical protein